MTEPVVAVSEQDRVTLVELVNRVVDRGVVLGGDITISVADIDLLYLGLRVLLCSPDLFSGPPALSSGSVAGSTVDRMGAR
jgi:hypothetical protein